MPNLAPATPADLAALLTLCADHLDLAARSLDGGLADAVDEWALRTDSDPPGGHLRWLAGELEPARLEERRERLLELRLLADAEAWGLDPEDAEYGRPPVARWPEGHPEALTTRSQGIETGPASRR